MRGTEAMVNTGAETWFYLFRCSVPLRVRLHETLRAIGDTGELTCLDVGAPNGAISYYLRKHGGRWHSAAMSDDAERSLRAMVDENVHRLQGRTLPFKKKVFDVVVIFGGLEGFESDEVFIEECHRILKPDGRLVVNVSHQKPVSLVRPLRALLNVIRETPVLRRTGYTESQLFAILKHGFDVHNVRSYSRALVEFVDTVVLFFTAGVPPGEPGSAARMRRVLMFAGPFYWLASQLDLLLFFTRGYYLVASAKRRAWRPRNAPVLVDGRSISEVVLSKAAD